MSPIEKVARAIEKAGFKWIEEHDDCGWADIPEEVFARAALLAIREPDGGMIEAGIEAFREEAGVLVARRDPPLIFAAMIDHALTQENGAGDDD